MTTKHPEFIVFGGPMFSGKSSRLIAAIDRFTYQHRQVVCFKPTLDDRYSETYVVTHGGTRIPAIPVATGAALIAHVQSCDDAVEVVAVDEAFMIDGVADALITLFRLGYTILVSSLEMSASCNQFDEMTQIMLWATRIEKLPAVCAVCQQDAYYTHKRDDTAVGVEIQVGGSEMYEPRCWEHHGFTNLRDTF